MRGLCFLVVVAFLAGGVRTSEGCSSSLWSGQIQHDLYYFRAIGGITYESLKDAQDAVWSGFRVLIHDNQLYAMPFGHIAKEKPEHLQRHGALLLLLKAMCRYKFPNVEFVMNVQDRRSTQHLHRSPPVFSFGKDQAYEYDILYPYFNVLWSKHERATYTSQHVAWPNKESKAVWRGAPTGGRFTLDSWRRMTRPRLVRTCRKRPDLCDAGFYHFHANVADTAVRAEMEQEFGLSNKIADKDLMRYKYLVLVDGNQAPASRTVHFMYTNSTIFRQESHLEEFFYRDLQPMVHYVPLTFHVSDVTQKVLWARENDVLCELIAKNAYDYAQTHFTDENIACFWFRLLTEYASLLQFKPTLTSEYASHQVTPAQDVWHYFLQNTDYPCKEFKYVAPQSVT